jgi:uncharacterized membrane protein
MRHLLAIATVVWMVLLGGAWSLRAAGEGPVLSTAVYLAAARVCHQRADRSLHTADVQWPVCARCSGLYLAAPVGALAALAAGATRRGRRWRGALAIASVPTIATIAVEWTGLAPIGNMTRLLAAVPLGAAVAFVIVSVAGERAEPIG